MTYSHPAYKVIEEEIAPASLSLFLEKGWDYGGSFLELGEKAQYVDISRKVKKLRRALWEGEELRGEQVEEILNDLIGHCWLTLYLLREGNR